MLCTWVLMAWVSVSSDGIMEVFNTCKSHRQEALLQKTVLDDSEGGSRDGKRPRC